MLLAALVLCPLLNGAALQEENPPQDPPVAAEEESGEPAETVQPPEPAWPDYGTAATWAELEAALRTLANARPDVASLESIGKSRGGRDVWVLTLSDRFVGDPAGKPGLVVLDYHAPGEGAGASVALEIARLLVEESRNEPTLDAILQGYAVYVVPCLDPDLRAPASADPAAERVEYAGNFPIGWRPDSLLPGSGAYPLSEPRTLALAEFLATRANVSILLGFGGEGRTAEGLDAWEVPAADRARFDVLYASGAVVPEVENWHEVPSGGSPFDYGYRALGMYPVILAQGSLPRSGAARADWVRSATRRALGYVGRLPRVSFGEPEVERLGPGLWRLDVPFDNHGLLPTLSELGRRRFATGEIEISVSGATVVACSHRPDGVGSFSIEANRRTSFRVGQIGAGETTELCLIVEGQSGDVLELEGTSARGGRAARTITLP
ncbi:MAG: M14 family zinc carboxypeptidase [Planctomycetota bacterium]|nr:M14 family zinc carboxypeptidase [Planctomycetota bacterium]